jgi:hypothetical protein
MFAGLFVSELIQSSASSLLPIYTGLASRDNLIAA